MLSEFGRNVVEMLSKCCRNVVKMLSNKLQLYNTCLLILVYTDRVDTRSPVKIGGVSKRKRNKAKPILT